MSLPPPIFQQTSRNVDFFKALQFLFVSAIIGGGIWPNHPWVLFMMSNQHITTSVMFLVSGLLTHFRYRAFFCDPSKPHQGRPLTRTTLKTFYELRFGVYAPIIVVSLLWSLVLTICRSETRSSLKQIVATCTMTSSWWTLYPLTETMEPKDLAIPTLPALMLGSAFLTAWLCYPLMVRAVWLAEAMFRRWSRVAYLIGLNVLTALVVPVATCFCVRYLPQRELFHDKPVYDTSTVLSSALHWLHPLFVLPRFLAGVAAAELVHHLKWVTPGGEKANTSPASQLQSFDVFNRWVLPYMTDVLIVFTAFLYLYDPSHPEWWSAKMVARLAGWLSFDSALVPQVWGVVAPWMCFPLAAVCCVLVSHPFASRGIVWKVLVQDPILAVLPGRTAVIIPFFTPLILKSLPTSMQDEMFRGAGFFFLCFLIFTTSIPFYYYCYQPYHLWRSLRLAELTNATSPVASKGTFMPLPSSPASQVTDGGSPPSTPGSTIQLKFDVECNKTDIPPAKILTSPHYDPFYPGKEQLELKVYEHVASVAAPSLGRVQTAHLSAWHWMVKLFVSTQYVAAE